MRLFHSTTSPMVRKVLVAAHELGLAARLELCTLRPPTPLRLEPDLSRANPLSKIPALELDDGSTLFDSRVIVEYLDGLAGGGAIIPAQGEARLRVLRRQALGDGLVECGAPVFMERNVRPEALRWQEWVQGHLAKIDQALDALDREAPSFEPHFDIGQIAVACAIGWLAFRKLCEPLAGRTRLAAWYAGVEARPSMRATAPALPS